VKKSKTKDHFFVSRTGSIFVLTKFGSSWYLAGDPMSKDSTILWPVGAAPNFTVVNHYIKNKLGFIELK
jgi:hypothetical protein